MVCIATYYMNTSALHSRGRSESHRRTLLVMFRMLKYFVFIFEANFSLKHIILFCKCAALEG